MEQVVVAAGLFIIGALLVIHFSGKLNKKPDTTMTRLERQYFEQDVYDEQQAEDAKVELEWQTQIDTAFAELARRGQQAALRAEG